MKPAALEQGAAVLALLVIVGYWPGVLGAGTSLRWGLLWIGLPLLLLVYFWGSQRQV